MCKRKQVLKLNLSINIPTINEPYVHGSDASSLVSIANHGLLSRNDLDNQGFDVVSGENGFTAEAKADQPIRQGICLYRKNKAYEALHYTCINTNRTGLSYIPIIYGISDVKLTSRGKDIGHPVSKASIPVGSILKVYVESSDIVQVKQLLTAYNTDETLAFSDKVKGYDALFETFEQQNITNTQ